MSVKRHQAPWGGPTVPDGPTKSRSLATRMVFLTFAVVSLTVLVSAALALIGVYRVVSAEETARLVAYRQIILDDLTGRLTTADRVINSVGAASTVRMGDQASMRETVNKAAAANVEYFDLLVLADASGTVLAEAPDVPTPRAVGDQPYFTNARKRTEAAFTWERAGQLPRGGGLWISQQFGPAGKREVIIGRLRTSFMQRLVDDIASAADGRAAAVVDSSGTVVSMGREGPRFDLRAGAFVPDPATPGMGTIALSNPQLGAMRGYWADVDVAPDTHWRVLVAEPLSSAVARARMSLVPAALAILFAALLSVWAAGVFGRRLVGPLRTLAQRARAVYSGAFVQPVTVDRDDEVGELTVAFNAMALRLNALQELSQLLAGSTRLDEVVDGILSATEHLLGTGKIAVFLVDNAEDRLELAGSRGLETGGADITLPLDDDSWPARAIAKRRLLSYSHGFEPGPRDDMARLFGRERSRSGLAVPLVAGREAVGVVMVLSDRDAEYSDAELEMMRTFCAQASTAIESSRLFEEERRSRKEAEALREVAERLEGTQDLQAALENVASIAAELLGASCTGLAILPGRELGLEPLIGSVEGAEVVALWQAVLDRDTRADHEHDPIVIEDATADELTREYAQRRKVRSLMLVPLLQESERRGVMVLDCTETRRGFSARQVALAATIGREVSLAMDNAYLLHQARNRAANLETIFRISQAVSSSLQSTVVLNRVLDVVQKIFSADAVSLMTHDAAKRVIVTAMARGITSRDMLYFETDTHEDLPGEVFTARSAKVFSPLEECDTPLAVLAVEAGFHSLLAVPLLARGHSTGVLSVYSTDAEAFTPEDVELLLTFGTQAALAIDTARLYGREHRVASVLQASILPERLPELPGIECATVYRPSGPEAEIGGDYYDLFTAPDGRVVMAIADVAGKGVFAATKTSMIRYALRGMVAAGLGPAEAAAELNRMVSETGDASDIVTIWVGYLDTSAGCLSWADAGHPPALALEPSGTIRRLGPTGPVLGGVAGVRYAYEEIELVPGSTILLYTDGVTEARQGQKFFGEGRVRRALRGGGSAFEVANRLSVSVDRFAREGLRDDAAILVVRLLPGDIGSR